LLKTFQDGMRFNSADPAQSLILRAHHLGEVVITSGAIVVTNPLDNPDWPAFTTTVPLGRFPVFLSDAYLLTAPETPHHVVSAMARFQDKAPTKWQIAWQTNWDAGAAPNIEPERYVWGYLSQLPHRSSEGLAATERSAAPPSRVATCRHPSTRFASGGWLTVPSGADQPVNVPETPTISPALRPMPLAVTNVGYAARGYSA
jgi:hypothetical protein